MTGIKLVIDTNLLLLFVVGITNRNLITRHKRLKEFCLEDYDLLCQVIKSSFEVLVTPNTLTETSNLLGYINEPARTQLFETFHSFIQSTQEEYIDSRIASNAMEFLRLGLTDSGLLEITNESRSILTTDLDLYLSALSRGLSAVNFNHLRELSYQNL
ncbi:MAG: PIN domain-containing protein [Thermodesulfobacteriota bacterium]